MDEQTYKRSEGGEVGMSDREKVINGLRCCSEMSGEYCRKCPYQDECRDDYGIPHLANDALELLQEQDTSAWVSVKDRLPNEKINPNTNDFEYVLCYTIFGDVRAYKYGTPMFAKSPHFWDDAENADEYVTHWQYMPEPPKEVTP